MSPENSDGSALAGLFFLAFILIILFSPLWFLLLTWIIGARTEKRHYASIKAREEATARLPVVTVRQVPPDWQVLDARLATGHVVVAIDHFKRLLASLRNIFGGRVRSYESVIDRARREAVLRLKESCPDATLIMNLRVETSNISQTKRDRGTGAVEVLAYGTAVRRG
jgi:uncharacterized protein YbjQ (UPF0145 family)